MAFRNIHEILKIQYFGNRLELHAQMDFPVFMIPTTGKSLKKIWKLWMTFSIFSGWFDMELPQMQINVCKNIFAYLYSVHNITGLWTTMNKSMNKCVLCGYVSRDTFPVIEQDKWLCRTYLKKICGPKWKQ